MPPYSVAAVVVVTRFYIVNVTIGGVEGRPRSTTRNAFRYRSRAVQSQASINLQSLTVVTI